MENILERLSATIAICAQILKHSELDLSILKERKNNDGIEAFEREIDILKNIISATVAILEDIKKDEIPKSTLELIKIMRYNIPKMLRKVASKRSLHKELVKTFEECYEYFLK